MSPVRPEILAALPGGADAVVERLAGDASTRSFYRVRHGGGTAIVMDYGGPFEAPSTDETAAAFFAAAGLPVPKIHESHPDAGFLVMEDLGDRLLEGVLLEVRGEGDPPASWLDAVALAARIADRGTAALRDHPRADGPALDSVRFCYEMDFFLEHYVHGLCRVRPWLPLRRALHRLADEAAETPRRVLCHRDYHSRNLLIRGDGSLAMVDIQDARWGPDTYDLASLARDAYVEIPEKWVNLALDRYLGELDTPPAAGFRQRFQVVSAQRMLKALGTFGYQTVERRSDRYREPIPRTLARLRALLPELPGHGALGEALDEADLLDPERGAVDH